MAASKGKDPFGGKRAAPFGAAKKAASGKMPMKGMPPKGMPMKKGSARGR